MNVFKIHQWICADANDCVVSKIQCILMYLEHTHRNLLDLHDVTNSGSAKYFSKTWVTNSLKLNFKKGCSSLWADKSCIVYLNTVFKNYIIPIQVNSSIVKIGTQCRSYCGFHRSLDGIVHRFQHFQARTCKWPIPTNCQNVKSFGNEIASLNHWSLFLGFYQSRVGWTRTEFDCGWRSFCNSTFWSILPLLRYWYR